MTKQTKDKEFRVDRFTFNPGEATVINLDDQQKEKEQNKLLNKKQTK